MTDRLTLERSFTTKDFTALRAYVQRIPPAVIARTYYDPDEDAHAATPGAMERHLARMLDTLVQLAIAHGSTVLADHLRASIRQHGQPKCARSSFRRPRASPRAAQARSAHRESHVQKTLRWNELLDRSRAR